MYLFDLPALRVRWEQCEYLPGRTAGNKSLNISKNFFNIFFQPLETATMPLGKSK
jgi:hypothetical protein